ncbi:MAG: hypothetical protein ACTHL8_13830 [Burkholderiaceae bacterium]
MLIAIITTYKPDAQLRARFEPLLEVCEAIVVVDNTPGGHRGFALPPRFEVIVNGDNFGIGQALNIGLREARRLGATEVILFDQDSSPSANLARMLSNALRDAVREFGPRVAVAPLHVDDGTGRLTLASGPRPARRHPARFERASHLPTSGILLPLPELDPTDEFSDDLFLDFADWEWCWRLGLHGWIFVRDTNIAMLHRMGISERRYLGLRFHVPPVYRHYFQFRDTLRLVGRAYVPLSCRLRLLALLPPKAMIYPFILNNGWERFCWMAKGVRDAARGVKGMGAASTILSR